MNIDKMSEEGAVRSIEEICEGLKACARNNGECAKYLLANLVEVLDDLNGDDFFGTEGWQHAFGMEE